MAKQYGNAISVQKRSSKKTLSRMRDERPNLRIVQQEPKKKWYQRVFCVQPLDYTVVFLVLFLTMFGLVMVYSTSSYKSSVNYNGDTTHWLVRQAAFAAMGVAAMFIISFLDYHIYNSKWFQIIAYGVILISLGAILIMGVAKNGAKRWTTIGGVNIQPSEFAKIIIILFLAYFLTNFAERLSEKWRSTLAFASVLPIIGLVGIENMSTAIILTIISIGMIFVACKNMKAFIAILLVGVAGGIALLFAEPYRLNRIRVWLDPEGSAESGRQTLQGLYAIGSGGIFGKGLGQSMQKMGFVPESHNDMIFSIICEELGLFGAIAIIALFFILIWRFTIIAFNAKELFGSLIVIGVITHLGFQVFVNIGVVTNTIPNTGIPLPFISYGGSSLLCLLIEMGLVLSVSRQIRVNK